MSGKIWLITEDENDYITVRAIIEKLKIPIRVVWRSGSGKTPGLSRLAAELNQIIANIRNEKTFAPNDCIAVLHDQDMSQPDRDNYNKIRNICRDHGIKLVVAEDEIEAWLLSDSGICAWLGQRQQTWNGEPKPSDELKSMMNRRYRLPYPSKLNNLLKNLAGDGINQSFKNALAELRNAPCID